MLKHFPLTNNATHNLHIALRLGRWPVLASALRAALLSSALLASALFSSAPCRSWNPVRSRRPARLACALRAALLSAAPVAVSPQVQGNLFAVVVILALAAELARASGGKMLADRLLLLAQVLRDQRLVVGEAALEAVRAAALVGKPVADLLALLLCLAAALIGSRDRLLQEVGNFPDGARLLELVPVETTQAATGVARGERVPVPVDAVPPSRADPIRPAAGVMDVPDVV